MFFFFFNISDQEAALQSPDTFTLLMLFIVSSCTNKCLLLASKSLDKFALTSSRQAMRNPCAADLQTMDMDPGSIPALDLHLDPNAHNLVVIKLSVWYLNSRW